MVFTSLREVSSCWQQDMNFCIWSFHFQTSEGGSAKSLIIDQSDLKVFCTAPLRSDLQTYH